MTCEAPKEAWDKLKEEFHGSDRTRKMQVLNLLRVFEGLKMKDEETIKEFSDKVLKVVNQLRLLGEDLLEKRIVNKVLQSHVEKVCKNKDAKAGENATVAEQKDGAEEFLFMARNPGNSAKKEIWLIDSACSNHMIGDESQFLTLNRNYKSTVQIGNGDLLQICRKGTVTGIKSIPNVHFVPDVKQNLLSVG
ncbi:uncharacterized protein LOC110429189 [Herrania umbratica]|uniref:Uncharacterized protein LOC110429189 n=1 Tax=Herrania umbratica TaxID=108875 RepID=A0A6J1BMW4_9ROSI|nr:uncharacterized protein LOC110429189 [Herrania umbratica]